MWCVAECDADLRSVRPASFAVADVVGSVHCARSMRTVPLRRGGGFSAVDGRGLASVTHPPCADMLFERYLGFDE
ncbi:hypothetical protein AB1Y20_016610 [Prymnesium parvum]|uniref:Uncharacterized protein n=1 Tax=Prymnesium parvum TaxID=97485 RepID=A0AB34ICV4_PRYPA